MEQVEQTVEKNRSITVEQAKAMREKCKENISRGQALNRLYDNADFKLIFLKEYIEKEPSRIVCLLGDASINGSSKKFEQREEFHESMIGIARFAEYLRKIFLQAELAEREMEMLADAEKRFYEGNIKDETSYVTNSDEY